MTDSLLWSDAVIDAMRQKGDSLADGVVGELIKCWRHRPSEFADADAGEE